MAGFFMLSDFLFSSENTTISSLAGFLSCPVMQQPTRVATLTRTPSIYQHETNCYYRLIMSRRQRASPG